MKATILCVVMAFVLLSSAIAFAQPGPTGDVTVPTTYWHAIAGFANTTPVADGVISAGEYNSVPLEVTKALMQASPTGVLWTYDDTTYTGDADWSLKVYFSWDWENFYIGYDVTDDIVRFPSDWENQWNSSYHDSIDILYDLFGAESADVIGAEGLWKIIGMWWLTGGRSDGTTNTFGNPINYGRWNYEGSALFGTDGDYGPSGWTCETAEKTGGYIMEMIVPWSKFSFASTNGTNYAYTPALNNRIGFSFWAFDGEGEAERSFEAVCLTNSPVHVGFDCWSDPPTYADLILGGVTIPGGETVVPDVSALNQADATAALEAAGYVVQVEQEPSDTVAAGGVIRTEPASGTALASGETVTLVISTGAAGSVPAAGLIGLALIGGACLAGATAKLRKGK